MYHTEPPTDKTIREWYMNSSRVAACSFIYTTPKHVGEMCQICIKYQCAFLENTEEAFQIRECKEWKISKESLLHWLGFVCVLFNVLHSSCFPSIP